MTDPPPTLRAALCEALRSFGYVPDGFNETVLVKAILAKLSDPAVMDELARWLVEQKDGPFYPYAKQCLRQRTRNVVHMEPDGVPPNLEDRF